MTPINQNLSEAQGLENTHHRRRSIQKMSRRDPPMASSDITRWIPTEDRDPEDPLAPLISGQPRA